MSLANRRATPKSHEIAHVLLALGLGIVFLSGCRSVPPPSPARSSIDSQSKVAPTSDSATNPSANVFIHTPRPGRHFSHWQKLNPVWWFGNFDDPIPPHWYRPGQKCRNFMWGLRNPCHNFHFYVIGIADKSFVRVGRFPGTNLNPNGGWNWAVCQYKRLRLPFLAYSRGRFQTYWGWRGNGNFGMKLIVTDGGKIEKPPPPPAAEKTDPTTDGHR
jgi:hypothetical protein